MEPRQSEQIAQRPETMPTSPLQEVAGGQIPAYPERLAQSPEVGAAESRESAQIEASQVAMPAVQSLPTPVTSNQQASSATDDKTTLIANDDDLIEKEWVDKAKKIIAETKDDPYKRELEISKLQVEYIRKRYGREIGVAED